MIAMPGRSRHAIVCFVLAWLIAGCQAADATAATTPTAVATLVALPSPTSALLPFAVTTPLSGTVVHSASIAVSGTGPARARVVQDIRFAPDREVVVDAQGSWSLTVDLDEGDNALIFRVGDDRATEIAVAITYAPDQPSADPAAVAALGTYLIENFGSDGYETPWWHHIVAWDIENGAVVITVDLSEHDEDAVNICAAASGFAFLGEGFGVREGAVVVMGPNSTVIWVRDSVADRC